MKTEDLSEIEIVDLASLQDAILAMKGPFEGVLPLWRGHANIEWKLQAEVFRPASNRNPASESTLLGYFDVDGCLLWVGSRVDEPSDGRKPRLFVGRRGACAAARPRRL